MTDEEYLQFQEFQQRAAARQSARQPQPQPQPQLRQPQAPPRSTAQPRESLFSLGVAALLFGVPLWTLCAYSSLIGGRIGLNVVAARVHLPQGIPPITGWWVLLLIPIGLVFSFVEVKISPRRFLRGGSLFAAVVAIVLLALLHGMDLGSTFLDQVTLAPDAWPISVWLAQTVPAAVGWSVFITYLPEHLILAGLRWTGLTPLVRKLFGGR